jgi:Putative bacterial sensory transduction regulator
MGETLNRPPRLEVELAIILRRLGYSAVEHPDNRIESRSNSGTKFSLFIQEDGWLLFGLRLVNQFDFSLEKVNEFNRSFRFGKLCLDLEGDLYFSADMRVFRPQIAESFEDCVTLWDQLVGLLERLLTTRNEA